MKTSAKLSNLRRDIVNEYLPSHETQIRFLEIYNEILVLEGTPERQLDLSIIETTEEYRQRLEREDQSERRDELD